MGTYLLHNPWVRFYLLYVAALCAVCLWDYWRNRQASRDGARNLLNEAVQAGASPSPRPPLVRTLPGVEAGRRMDWQGAPTARVATWGALRAGGAAPTSGKRREYHGVTP
jgi:hypothetical protein